MAETGGTVSGEPFDIEELMDLGERLQTLQFARQSMGDERVKIIVGQDPAVLEATLRDKMAEGLKKLLELAKT